MLEKGLALVAVGVALSLLAGRIEAVGLAVTPGQYPFKIFDPSRRGLVSYKAHLIQPGSRIEVWGFDPEMKLAQCNARLWIYAGDGHDVRLPRQVGKDRTGHPIWADKTKAINLTYAGQKSETRNGVTRHDRVWYTVDDKLSCFRPGWAYLVLSYAGKSGGGKDYTVGLWIDPRTQKRLVPPQKFYFVPAYDSFSFKAKISAGWNAWAYRYKGSMPGALQSWRDRCWLIEEIAVRRTPNSAGVFKYATPFATVSNPLQGYYIDMPNARSAEYVFEYKIVGPRGEAFPYYQPGYAAMMKANRFVPRLVKTGPSRRALSDGVPKVKFKRTGG